MLLDHIAVPAPRSADGMSPAQSQRCSSIRTVARHLAAPVFVFPHRPVGIRHEKRRVGQVSAFLFKLGLTVALGRPWW